MNLESQQFRDSNKYCNYHQDIGHNTKGCKSLEREIIQVRENEEGQHLQSQMQQEKNLRPKEQSNNGTIFVIMGGEWEKRSKEVFLLESKYNEEEITFSSKDLENIVLPHQDPLVITPMINGFIV